MIMKKRIEKEPKNSGVTFVKEKRALILLFEEKELCNEFADFINEYLEENSNHSIIKYYDEENED